MCERAQASAGTEQLHAQAGGEWDEIGLGL